jgi:hypothetical protein
MNTLTKQEKMVVRQHIAYDLHRTTLEETDVELVKLNDGTFGLDPVSEDVEVLRCDRKALTLVQALNVINSKNWLWAIR